jgi:hypothetical protein
MIYSHTNILGLPRKRLRFVELRISRSRATRCSQLLLCTVISVFFSIGFLSFGRIRQLCAESAILFARSSRNAVPDTSPVNNPGTHDNPFKKIGPGVGRGVEPKDWVT